MPDFRASVLEAACYRLTSCPAWPWSSSTPLPSCAKLCLTGAGHVQEFRGSNQEALQGEEVKWLQQERILMERRVKHQVQVSPTPMPC